MFEKLRVTITFIFNFFNALKLRFPNSTVFTQSTEKCIFFRNLETHSCHKTSQFSYSSTRNCPNHRKTYKVNHCALEKVLLTDWLISFFRKSYYEYSRCNSQKEQPTASLITEFVPLSYKNT